MKLIADSGSTKTDWAIIDDSGHVAYFKSSGYNPNYVQREGVLADMEDNFPKEYAPDQVKELYFYGAGINSNNASSLESIFREYFPQLSQIQLFSDMLGAARALLGHKAGFTAILGTGANSCLYDGEQIIMNVSSLGFILGDEGSGAYMGKILLRDYMRETMPEGLRNEFSNFIDMSKPEIISQIYTKPKPNQFCGSLSSFAIQRMNTEEYCRSLIKSSFRDFFNNMICLYPDYLDYSLNCVGSVAYLCQDLLCEIAQEFNMKVGKIIQAPIEGLVSYHLD